MIEKKKLSTTISSIPSINNNKKFTQNIIAEIKGREDLIWGPKEKRLAQHLFIKIDQQLIDLETKRLARNEKKPSYIWANIDLKKLAVDAINRIELGLDALIPNHLHPIPYFITSKKLYEIDLQIGYMGQLYYKPLIALDPPKDIRIELVHKTDEFTPIKKSIQNDIEFYDFKIVNAFNRGEIVGGFGYLVYDEKEKNKLVLVSEEQFKKSEIKGNTNFWKNYPDEMRYAKLVTKICKQIIPDPDKVSEAVIQAEMQIEQAFERTIDENANKTIIDLNQKHILPDNSNKNELNNKATFKLTPAQIKLKEIIEIVGQNIVDEVWNDPSCTMIPKTTYDNLSDEHCEQLITMINIIIDSKNYL